MSDGLFPSANDAKSTFLLFERSSTDMLGRSLFNTAAAGVEAGAAVAEGFVADFGAAFFATFALVAAKDNAGEATMAATDIAATSPMPRWARWRRNG
jgi:hypothetical protein